MADQLAERFARWRTASPSHWHDTFPVEGRPAPSALPSRVRFAVVGLGITGAAIAYQLTLAGIPADEIVVLDACSTAFGASGRNAGFVLSYPGAAELADWERDFGRAGCIELLRLNIANREAVAAFARENDLPRQEGGSYFAATSEHEGRLVAASLTLVREAGGVGYELLPGIPGHWGFHGAMYQAADMGIHPAHYVAALIRAAGVPIVEDCLVAPDGLRRKAGAVELCTPKGTLVADIVLLAANAYLPLLLPDGLPAIGPARNQVILAQLDGEEDNAVWGDAIYYANDGFDYWRQFPDGTMLIGGGRNRDVPGEATWDLAQNAIVLDYLENTLLPRLAEGRTARVLKRWQGIMGMSPDGVPLLGPVKGLDDRVFAAAGFSGYGLGFHRAAARKLVEHVLHGGALGPFDAARITR